jgi:molybdopterin molybdotransferase
MVCFWLFVRPALRRLQGHPEGFWTSALEATVTAPLPAAGPRDRFLAASLQTIAGHLHATPWPARGSHDLGAYAHGTALLRIPAHTAAAPAGAHCSILPLTALGL